MNKVIDRKKVRGQNLLIMEGGINHLARPALTGQSFPCSLFRDSKAVHERFTVHGPLCTAMDKLGVYDLPNDMIKLLDVRCKNHFYSKDEYRTINRHMFEPYTEDSDQELL